MSVLCCGAEVGKISFGKLTFSSAKQSHSVRGSSTCESGWQVSQPDGLFWGKRGAEEVEMNLRNACSALISHKRQECHNFLGKCGNGWTCDLPGGILFETN